MTFEIPSSWSEAPAGVGSQSSPTRRRTFTGYSSQFIAISMLVIFGMIMTACTVAADIDDTEEAMRRAREAAKPWLMRELEINGTKLIISPATIICVLVFVVNLWSWLSFHTSGTWAEASHILLKDTSKKTHKALLTIKQDAGSNAKKFGEYAKQYSNCPSKSQNGDLGRFQKGTMAPPFDKVVFDPKTPLNQTIGPIETQFGYHLIYIRNRKM